MYDKLNITENTLRVLSLFTNDFNSTYYIREVEMLLKISPRTAQLSLENLEGKGIIESKMRGKIKSYKLQNNDSAKNYLVLVERYKLLTFMSTQLIVKEIIEKITPHIQGIGVIFGSYVKGLEKKNSDLDIFVAGSYDDKEIEKISRMFGVEINVKCYPLKLFEKKINQDILLNEILKNHIVFLNIEQFIRQVLKNG